MIQSLIYAYLITWPLFVESWTNKLVLQTGGLPKLDITRAFSIVILFVAVVYKSMRGKRVKGDVIVITTLLFSAYFFLEIVLNDLGVKLSTAFAGLFHLCLIPCVMYFALTNLYDVLNRRHLAYAVLLGGVFMAGSGVAEFMVGHNLLGPANYLSNDRLAGVYRTNGPFWDVISYAGIVAGLVPFAYWALKAKMVNKWFGYFCLVLFSAGALASFSRIILIALALVWIVLYFGKNKKNFFLVFFVGGVLGISAYFLSDAFFASKLYTSRLAVGSEGRYAQFLNAIKVFWRAPFFGAGYEMYAKMSGFPMHNTFLRILVDFGLLGLFFYIPLVLSLLFHKFKGFTKDSLLARVRFCLFIIVVLVSSAIDLLGSAPFVMMLYILTAVMTLDDRVPVSKKKANSLPNAFRGRQVPAENR